MAGGRVRGGEGADPWEFDHAPVSIYGQHKLDLVNFFFIFGWQAQRWEGGSGRNGKQV